MEKFVYSHGKFRKRIRKARQSFPLHPRCKNAKMRKCGKEKGRGRSGAWGERSVRQCIKIFEKCTDTQQQYTHTHTTVWECVCVCAKGCTRTFCCYQIKAKAGKKQFSNRIGCILSEWGGALGYPLLLWKILRKIILIYHFRRPLCRRRRRCRRCWRRRRARPRPRPRPSQSRYAMIAIFCISYMHACMLLHYH